MSPDFTANPKYNYDYVQTGSPQNPEEGESWYDLDGNKAYVYDGSSWTELTVTSHDNLSNVSESDHFTPGGVLQFNTGTLDLIFGEPLQNDNGTLSMSIGNGLSLSNGSLVVNEGQISHDNLSNISSDDHHSQVHDNSDHSTNYAVSGHNHDSRYYQPNGNDKMVVETRTSDPQSPSIGREWLREDL